MHFDDLAVGETMIVGQHHFTLHAIVAFAGAFDPQPFHLDEEAGRRSHFDGLVASGWHTIAAWMRLTVDEAARRGFVIGMPKKIASVQWLKPVRPGDTLTYTAEIRAKEKLAARPGWTKLTLYGQGINQDGEEIFQLSGDFFRPIEHVPEKLHDFSDRNVR